VTISGCAFASEQFAALLIMEAPDPSAVKLIGVEKLPKKSGSLALYRIKPRVNSRLPIRTSSRARHVGVRLGLVRNETVVVAVHPGHLRVAISAAIIDDVGMDDPPP